MRRPSLMIIDDIVSDEEDLTEEDLQKVRQWFKEMQILNKKKEAEVEPYYNQPYEG